MVTINPIASILFEAWKWSTRFFALLFVFAINLKTNESFYSCQGICDFRLFCEDRLLDYLGHQKPEEAQ